MHAGVVERILGFIAAYGYVFLFAASAAESTFVVGLFVPGDLAVVIGGGLSAGARLAFVPVALSALVGAWMGSCLSFWIGRRGGLALVERWGARLSMDEAKVRGVEDYFRSHGAKTVFLATFVAGLKNLVPALAGASSMSFLRFCAYAGAGASLRSVGLVGVGYFFGANLPRALEVIGKANGWAVGVIAAVLVVVALRALKKRRRSKGSGAKSEDRVDPGATP